MSRGRAEYRAILAGLSVVALLASLTSVWPALDAVLGALLLGVIGTAVAGYWLREAVRELRFRRDMRALDCHPPVRPEVRT